MKNSIDEISPSALKRRQANQANALLSTGPKTIQGKATIATNAIKHGIFTQDLIISSTLGQEDRGEYQTMLNNLVDCLSPQNQIESLLVEKIAIDFWRLRRVIRFEAGSIRKYLETIFKEFYSYGSKNNFDIDKDIERKKAYIDWIIPYIECLKKEEVSFDQAIWEGKDISSNILDDFHLILNTLKSVPYQEKERLRHSDSSHGELKAILSRNGYSSKQVISVMLIELYTKEKQRLEKDIGELEQNKLANIEADKLNSMLGMIPQEGNMDKILKYERSLQKSICQNLFLLKKMQGAF